MHTNEWRWRDKVFLRLHCERSSNWWKSDRVELKYLCSSVISGNSQSPSRFIRRRNQEWHHHSFDVHWFDNLPSESPVESLWSLLLLYSLIDLNTEFLWSSTSQVSYNCLHIQMPRNNSVGGEEISISPAGDRFHPYHYFCFHHLLNGSQQHREYHHLPTLYPLYVLLYCTIL